MADPSGTMKGPMKTADGRVIPPTNRSFHVEFCTVAHWNDKGEILEERLFCDLVGLMKQVGLSWRGRPQAQSIPSPPFHGSARARRRPRCSGRRAQKNRYERPETTIRALELLPDLRLADERLFRPARLPQVQHDGTASGRRSEQSRQDGSRHRRRQRQALHRDAVVAGALRPQGGEAPRRDRRSQVPLRIDPDGHRAPGVARERDPLACDKEPVHRPREPLRANFEPRKLLERHNGKGPVRAPGGREEFSRPGQERIEPDPGADVFAIRRVRPESCWPSGPGEPWARFGWRLGSRREDLPAGMRRDIRARLSLRHIAHNERLDIARVVRT